MKTETTCDGIEVRHGDTVYTAEGEPVTVVLTDDWFANTCVRVLYGRPVRSVRVRTLEGDGRTTIAQPGYDGPDMLIINGVPQDVTDSTVLDLVSATAIMPNVAACEYANLGHGRIVRPGHE